LTAGLLVNKGLHKVPNGFALMAMCPGQHILDIMVETSSRTDIEQVQSEKKSFTFR
jgi:hypothetical protein